MNSPMALDPPPTQAAMASGRAPVSSRHWARASSPMPRQKSRTMAGNGCGPAAVPKQYAVWSTLATQSRIASLMASLSVRDPEVTGITSAPSSCIRATLSACRSVSTSPM